MAQLELRVVPLVLVRYLHLRVAKEIPLLFGVAGKEKD
jgi:hypothetical protein